MQSLLGSGLLRFARNDDTESRYIYCFTSSHHAHVPDISL